MGKKRTPTELVPAESDDDAYEAVLADVTDLLESARHAAARSVNSFMTGSYWAVGRRIVEEEQKGQNLLPISFLRQLISLYGDSMQFMVPRYLEQSMSSFSANQEQMRKSLQDAFGGLFPFGSLEEMGKQNLALFEKTMKMFSPLLISSSFFCN